MPPVHHWASGMCRVPVSMPDEIRTCFPLETDDPDWFWSQVENENWSMAVWNAVWGLRPLWFWSEEFVAVDAGMLSELRNGLDSLVMASQGCELFAEDECVPAPPGGEFCNWCEYCMQITMRDRISTWLERSGHMGSSYYQAYGRPHPDEDAEAAWALVWSGATYPSQDANDGRAWWHGDRPVDEPEMV